MSKVATSEQVSFPEFTPKSLRPLSGLCLGLAGELRLFTACHCTGIILVVSVTHAWPASPCSALVPEMLVGSDGTSQRGCAHAEVFRKPGTTMFSRLIHWFAPAA